MMFSARPRQASETPKPLLYVSLLSHFVLFTTKSNLSEVEFEYCIKHEVLLFWGVFYLLFIFIVLLVIQVW